MTIRIEDTTVQYAIAMGTIETITITDIAQHIAMAEEILIDLGVEYTMKMVVPQETRNTIQIAETQ